MNVTKRTAHQSTRIRKLVLVPTTAQEEEMLEALHEVLSGRLMCGFQVYRNGAGGLEWSDEDTPRHAALRSPRAQQGRA